MTMSRRNVEKQTILFYSVHPTHPPPPKPPKVVAPGVKSPQSGTFGLLAQILVLSLRAFQFLTGWKLVPTTSNGVSH